MASLCEECPICFSAYREPKGLPCFHTFCRECLQSHINNTANNWSFFNCPMCRKRTVPFTDKSMPIKDWASSFPTNNYILNRYAEMSKKQCPAHQNELLDINCKTCHIMICYQCCMGAHQKCEVTLTKHYAKKIKRDMADCLQTLEVELEPIEKRLDQLEEDKESRGTQIREMAEELSTFVHNQAERWLGEIETAHLKESGALQERRDNLAKFTTRIKENIADMDSFIGDDEEAEGAEEDAQSFRRTHDYQPKHDLTPLRVDLEELKVEKVDFEINKKFVKLKDEILQENMVESTPVPIEEDLPSYQETYFFTEKLFGLNDLVVLPNNNILITEACYKRLWKFSPTGQCLQKVTFKIEPFGLCILPDNCIAVSQPAAKRVSIWDCESLTETESFSFETAYHGVASDDNGSIFGLYRASSIQIDIISKNNPQSAYQIMHCVTMPLSIFACDKFRLRVLPSSGNIIIINWASPLSAICISQSGMVLFKYAGAPAHKLSSISDIAVSGNCIFIADKAENKIHQILHDGSFVDVPFTANDDIFQPRKIFVGDDNRLAILSQTDRNSRLQLFST